MVFQDPYSSLNPRHCIGDILTEPLWFYDFVKDPAKRASLAASMLSLVGMQQDAITKYPHQFSGGQRQRIAVARALLARPRFLICDEPTSALDVSIQAEILNLLKELQARFGLTILFISHNLAVVRQMADDTAVLRYGKIEEVNTTEAVYQFPQAEYTKSLLAQTPIMPKFWRQ
tara:strand:- start:914 stop:1435 length:522 start_codon:yes stop_codon:yes gene_type:complete